MSERQYILYRWFDADGRLLYVGKSISVLARITRHRAASPFFQDAVSMTMERFPDAASLAAGEGAAIRAENPSHNIRGVAPREIPDMYSIPAFAAAVSLSAEKIRQHIRRGELVPSYVGAKPLIRKDEGLRWLATLPAERPTR